MLELQKRGVYMKKYPLKLSPVFKEIIWGGDKLKKEYNKKTSIARLAESWELTCQDNNVNNISNGIYKGMSLSEYLGKDSVKFPVLVKLIDAHDDLSVQVHPDKKTACKEDNEREKNEIWYIVEADKDAKIVYGINCSEEQFRDDLKNNNIQKDLQYVDVKKGDAFYIPSGCVHAIGKGILIAEIQQSSDTTYRLYDYNRPGLDGKPRQLHIEKGIKTIKKYTKNRIKKLQFKNGLVGSTLANNDYFTVVKETAPAELFVGKRFMHILCLDGKGKIKGVPAEKGDSFYLPKWLGKVKITGDLSMIITTV